MTDTPHAFLVDMLAMHNTAAAYGCGLKPRLAQMLLNRHTPPAGAVQLGHRIRADGPAQAAPPGMTRIDRAVQGCERPVHVRR